MSAQPAFDVKVRPNGAWFDVVVNSAKQATYARLIDAQEHADELERTLNSKKRTKYNNKKVYDEDAKRWFDSRVEHVRYRELLALEKAGHISGLTCQPRYVVIPKFKDNCGNFERAVTYKADFRYTENGRTVVEDVKSKVTAAQARYVLVRKLFKRTYPDIVFREVIR